MPIPKYPSLVPLKHILMFHSIPTPLLSHLALQHTIISKINHCLEVYVGNAGFLCTVESHDIVLLFLQVS
jgi:hypothetical protein